MLRACLPVDRPSLLPIRPTNPLCRCTNETDPPCLRPPNHTHTTAPTTTTTRRSTTATTTPATTRRTPSALTWLAAPPPCLRILLLCREHLPLPKKIPTPFQTRSLPHFGRRPLPLRKKTPLFLSRLPPLSEEDSPPFLRRLPPFRRRPPPLNTPPLPLLLFERGGPRPQGSSKTPPLKTPPSLPYRCGLACQWVGAATCTGLNSQCFGHPKWIYGALGVNQAVVSLATF